jgi:hypothetical protein
VKLLFLHSHPHFAPPFIRSIPALREHGIEATEHKVTTEDEARRYLSPEYDVILLQEPPIFECVLASGVPVILLERVDGAQLRQARTTFHRVAGVIKGYSFRDRTWHNKIPDRAHIGIMHEMGLPCSKPIYHDRLPSKLPMSALRRLRVGYGFGATDHIGQSLHTVVDLAAARPIDVHFAGTVSYENSEVDTHRHLALQAARDWPGTSVASGARRIKGAEYRAGILLSKCVLCPWGWGEPTYRDYEAIALGAVMIKPETAHVECWPDVYQAGKTYVPCRPDFQDAHEKIAHVVAHWDEYLPMRVLARKLAEAAWRPDLIAQRMATLIKELLGC